MKTEQLYEFLVLSRTLNYSRAADALYISQSVLSKHILEMEQELNTSLLGWYEQWEELETQEAPGTDMG